MKVALENTSVGPTNSRSSDNCMAPRTDVNAAIEAACNRIAPLWPLKSFVAVNPFLGFSDTPFHEACATFRRVNRVDVLMPREFYKEAVDSKVVENQDLESALSSAPKNWLIPKSVELLKAHLGKAHIGIKQPRAVVATISEVLDRLAHGNRQSSRTAFMIDEISKFCASYYDEGQALLPFPLKGQPLYSAWLASQKYDRNPEFMGLKHFRKTVAQMPKDPLETIKFVVEALGIPERAVEDYLYRALFDINGWASYVRHLVWKSELKGEQNDSLIQLLAIRVVWGYGLFLERRDAEFKSAWRSAMEEAAKLPQDNDLSHDSELALDAVLHEAYERAHQRILLKTLGKATTIQSRTSANQRPSVQAAFCIDVRSEVFRRTFESTGAGIETIGFAGFFGIPFEFVPIGEEKGRDQFPVLLKSAFRVTEGLKSGDEKAEESLVEAKNLRKRTAGVWRRFKQSAVSCFAYVEAVGVFALINLVRDSFGLKNNAESSDLKPIIGQKIVGGQESGFTDAQKLQVAKAILKAMSLTKEFSPLVVLVGHGSATVNNPHASGLDCGACGGHSGEVNARVVAGILNEPVVRDGLRTDGILIPEETWFLGGLHNTTTDEVTVFEIEEAPANLHGEIERLQSWLDQASRLARAERSPLLGLPGKNDSESQVLARSSDWSQVRPEWGLAGNTAFIVAPRIFTANVDLRGRAFLHTYDWKADQGFGVLELIMTAPMIVASWINLQYFASTTNNPVFGAGNKVLHNVTGTIGVIEGNAGDLRVGLPWQSVHDGNQFVHKPLRLNVVIAAPIQAINGVIQKHPSVRNLVDNKWIHLYAQADDGQVSHKYAGNLVWE